MSETTWTRVEIDELETMRVWESGQRLNGSEVARKAKAAGGFESGVDVAVCSSNFADALSYRLRDDFRPVAAPVVTYWEWPHLANCIHSHVARKFINGRSVEGIAGGNHTVENFTHAREPSSACGAIPVTEERWNELQRKPEPQTRPITAEELTAAIAAIPRTVPA